MTENKRLFFGAQVSAPWPPSLPSGRIIEESSRHLTLLFLGNAPPPPFSPPPFPVGPVGICNRLLFLPQQHPRVVAYHVHWLDDKLQNYHKTISHEELLSHVTLARAPLDVPAWQASFYKIPLFIKAFHLYESVGSLTYKPLSSFPLIAPFEEFEHTADIAFHIRAEKPRDLLLDAQIALAFKFPQLLPYFSQSEASTLEEIVPLLNKVIAKADAAIGCPFKAVSFSGNIESRKSLLHWEMIVDV